ncbi:hypothetical protein DID88_000579 [Monilinia fructigena]|uniref:TERF2-interacting telomeric protein 1 Myb domain-containing protein n=1 Tax=Monilinia fructigena TaxID=38457 RepID=A0A395IKQ2_9HELO|nr:hypothetical protein DID88_000579 [Monilinia fructigena]
MESPARRQKISADLNDLDLEIDGDYSDSCSEVEEDDFIIDDENDDVVYEPGYDPDQELQQRRARLDFKLKSTFESIFEKYGRNFDGVGDEIDLLTGEILVDNGHLKDMQDERDAGDQKAGSNLLRALTVEPESIMETSGDEYNMEEEVEDSEERGEVEEDEEEGSNVQGKMGYQDNAAEMGDGDMEEDDMILRGYDEPIQDSSVDVATTTESETTQNHAQESLQYQRSLQPEEGSVSFPTYNEILRSFGPEVAPQIVNIISRKQGQDDASIEPAWRVPELPESEPRKRPELRSFIPEPEIMRSPSPDMSESIWALPRGRGQRPLGKIYKPRGPYKRKSIVNEALSSDGLRTSDNTASDSLRIRNNFTEEEDEILIAKLSEAHGQGIPFGTKSIWKDLESLNSRHTKRAWKSRYLLKYRHLWSPEGSPRSGSHRSYRHEIREKSEQNVRSTLRSPHQLSIIPRSSRTRKPAQQGLNVISWSDAVATIKSIDPRLHKDLAKDASVFDLTDVRPVDVDEDALNLRSSDLEVSGESSDEPELPAHIGSRVQRIAPITANPAYQFSDEEDEPAVLRSKFREEKSSQLKTPRLSKKVRKSSSGKLKDGSSGKPRYRQRQVQKKLISEEVDELSFGLEEDVLFVSSRPRKDKQREPQTSIQREDGQAAVTKMSVIPDLTSKERMSALSNFDDDEFDELSVEWLQSFPSVDQKKAIFKSEDVLVAGPPNTAKEANIDLFDINQLPETSPRSALDARKKLRLSKRFSSSAVIPSTSSQTESSPIAAADSRVQWRSQPITDSVDHASIPPTSVKRKSRTPLLDYTTPTEEIL